MSGPRRYLLSKSLIILILAIQLSMNLVSAASITDDTADDWVLGTLDKIEIEDDNLVIGYNIDFGDGRDGDRVVSDTQTIGTSYSISSIDSNSVTTSEEPSGISVGDQVLLINLQGSSIDTSRVGTYEFLTVSGVVGNTTTFTTDIQKEYGDPDNQKIVIQRIPQYQNVIINDGGVLTANAWDGTKGGVLVFKVSGDLRIESGGRIDMKGRGYRGGSGLGRGSNWGEYAWQGESVNGVGGRTTSANIHAGGGGRQGFINLASGSGGGGGGYGTQGVNGGSSTVCVPGTCLSGGQGGSTLGSEDLSNLYFGGGGGGGGGFTGFGDGGNGGRGGGIVIIFAKEILIEEGGNINANGGDGGSFVGSGGGGGGGGGAGGSIYLKSVNMAVSGSINSLGGGVHGIDGLGGKGRIRLDYGKPPLLGTIDPNPYIHTFQKPNSATYTSRVFDAGSYVTWDSISWVKDTPGGSSVETYAMSCDDAACSGESWSAPYTTSPQNLSLALNRYFRYRAVITRQGEYEPILESVTIEYSLVAPAISMDVNPASVLKTWQPGSATATVTCTDYSGTGCDPASLKIKTYQSDPVSCPSDYAQYIDSSPANISDHLWVCGAGKDNTGTTGFSSPVEFKIDNEVSTITDDYPHDSTWVKGYYDITLNPQDTGESGLGEVRYCWGASCDPAQGTLLASPYAVSISGDIDNTLRYQAWDIAGNPSEIGSISVKVDNTPPVTNCVNCPTGQIGNGRNIDLNPTDSTSDVDYTKYCVVEKPASCEPANGQLYDEQQKIPVGFGCPVPDTCEYVLKYFSVDIAENQEAVKSANIVVNRTRPWCSLEQLPTYTTKSQISLQWDGDDPGGDPLDKFEIQFNRRDTPNDGWGLWTLVGSFSPTEKSTTFDASQYGGDGEYEFKCILSTQPGEQSEPDTTSTILDTQDPSVSFSLPEWSNKKNFSISWTASDSLSGLDFTIIFVNSGQWRQVPGTTTSQEYQGQNGQSYDIKLDVYDKAGNSKQTSELTITVDTQPPSCSISPLDEFTNKKVFNISWSSPDLDTQSYDICINSDGSECTQPNMNWGGLTVKSKEFTGTQGSKYYFRCRAKDRAGNTGSWSSSVSTTIDAEPPELDEDYNSKVVAGDVLEDLEVNTTVTDDFGIKEVVFILGDDEINPKSKTGTSGDKEWTLKWEIPYSTYGSYNGFTITVTDINNNVDVKVFNYSILDCRPGQIRSCDPRDPSTDKLYNKGVCKHSGNRTCGSDGKWSNCTGGILPTEEDCNNLDDDCDGKTDEGLERKECGFNNIGICRLGLRDCENGEWGDCIGAKLPADEEVCGNNWDDDCNGFTDEGCVGVCNDGDTQPCGQSDTGICKLGYQICSGATWDDTCHNVVYPESELCDDNLDNDCDGYTDCYDTDCIGTSICEVPSEPGEPFPWWILSVIGVIVLVVLAILWIMFKRKGEELTWETLKKKWESPDWF